MKRDIERKQHQKSICSAPDSQRDEVLNEVIANNSAKRYQKSRSTRLFVIAVVVVAVFMAEHDIHRLIDAIVQFCLRIPIVLAFKSFRKFENNRVYPLNLSKTFIYR